MTRTKQCLRHQPLRLESAMYPRVEVLLVKDFSEGFFQIGTAEQRYRQCARKLLYAGRQILHFGGTGFDAPKRSKL